MRVWCGDVCRFLGFASGSRCFDASGYTGPAPCVQRPRCSACLCDTARWEGRSCAFPYIQARICLVELGPREPVKVPHGGMGSI